MAVKHQGSFTGGELSPSLYSRVDIQKYQFGLRKALNFFIHTHGGASNRPGYEFLYRRKYDNKASRNIPFQFNTVQSYTLEFGDQYMRVWKDGGLVLEGAQALTSPYATIGSDKLHITGHPFVDGEWVYISGVDSDLGDILNGKYFIVDNAAANDFTLTDIDGNAIDFDTYSAPTAGNVYRVYEIATPYLEADLFNLKYTQSADTMTLTHPSYQQRNLTRSGHASWSLSTITFAPQATAPSTVNIATFAGSVYSLTYRVTAVDSNGEESLSTQSASANAPDLPSLTVGTSAIVSWSAVSGATKYNIYRSNGNSGGGPGSVFGYVGSCDASATSLRDHITNPDYADPAPETTARNPYNSADNYPGCCTYFKQRLCFAGTNNNPQSIETTQIGRFKNMNTSNPSQGDDAISMTLNSTKVNEIRHLVPLAKRMLAMTVGSIWTIGGDSDGVFTPASANADLETEEGCSHVRPIVSSSAVLYVEEGTSYVKSASYSFESDSYRPDDLSLLAAHLFDGHEIVDWCYQKSPYSLIWAVREDGKLLCLTYQREHEVWAWTLHETEGQFETVCCIRENGQDEVYAGIRRYINGGWKRYMEKLHTRDFAGDIRNAFFVDSGLSYDPAVGIEGISIAVDGKVTVTITAHTYNNGDEIDLSDIVAVAPEAGETNLADLLNNERFEVADKATNTFRLKLSDGSGDYVDATDHTAYDSSGFARLAKNTLSGLDHLEGETLVALCDGGVETGLVVTNGSVTLEQKASRVHIGLSYISDIETLDLEVPAMDSFGKRKAVDRIHAKLQDSRGGKYGPDATHLDEHYQREDEDWGDPTSLFDGEFDISITSTWENSGRVLMRQDEPLPITILSLSPEFEVG